MIVEQASVLTPPRFYTDYVSERDTRRHRKSSEAKGENWGALELFKTLDVFQKYGDTIVPVEYGTAFDSHGTGVTTLGAFYAHVSRVVERLRASMVPVLDASPTCRNIPCSTKYPSSKTPSRCPRTPWVD